jgi:predicted phage baseplate assembly protein
VSAGCGCCAGVGRSTPLELENRPGLSAIAYRVGVHSEFLASMIAGLTDPDRPRLAELGTRDPDDFTIALLDAWAVTADVLSFYSERLAQESYLRTARDRISLQELGRLIGYRLRPGVAAQTYVAFALEPPPPVPPSADPGAAPPVTPASVQLDPGLRVQSIPGPGEQPQTFETVDAVEARPEWNAIPATQTKARTFALGDTHAYLRGAGLNLKAGDLLLLAGADILNEHWDLRTLTAVVPDATNDRTRVEWAEGLGSITPHADPAAVPTPYVLRKRIDVFGHNAPLWGSMSKDFRTNYPGGDDTRAQWPDFVISATGGFTVDLDGSHPDVVPGSWVVLSKPTWSELWQVERVTELNRAEFAVSGKVTRVTLSGGENYQFFQDEVRNTTVYGASELLVLADEPDTSNVAGNVLVVDTDVSKMTPGRRLLVRGTTTSGEDHAEPALLKAVAATGAKWQITLEQGLAATYERGSLVVHGNAALATHGETVKQLLGSGRASSAFQRFTLAHAPLTYVQSTADPSGIEAALEVRVNDVRWDEAATLYGAGRRDRSYAVRVDETGSTYVQFGDGEHGARLPSGLNNVRATYRKGLGAAGNVAPGALAQLLDRPVGVKGVSNPSAAEGGVDPETEEAARASIPLGVRTLGRAVSLLDYQDFALAFSGVVKANAAVLPLRGGRTIVVTVAFDGGDRLDDLADGLRTYGDPRVEVQVVAGTTETFRLALKVAVDPAYDAKTVLAAVETALRAAYAFAARDFVEPVFLSAIEATVHTVPGVLAVDVDLLYTGSAASRSERLLAQQPAVAAGGTAIPAGVLVLDPAPLDWLEQMT